MRKDFDNICVLKGGFSSEREISLLSGEAMAAAAKSLGYEVFEYDFTGDLGKFIDVIEYEKPDCVINALHGCGGEDGNIQAALNLLKCPYTHSGVLASSVAMDKYVSGLIFQSYGISIPKTIQSTWESFKNNHHDFPLPFVIKPVNGGSSCGVYIINDISELDKIEWVYGEKVLVSEYVPGLELTVGVLNGKALEVTNIMVNKGFYNYENKYTDGCAVHELPAKIPAEIKEKAMGWAEKAHALLECRGVTRSDFRYNDATGELFFLELNTQPGMTNLSLVPEQARHLGISFEQLMDKLIDEACYDDLGNPSDE